VARIARSAQSSRGRGWVRRSTAIRLFDPAASIAAAPAGLAAVVRPVDGIGIAAGSSPRALVRLAGMLVRDESTAEEVVRDCFLTLIGRQPPRERDVALRHTPVRVADAFLHPRAGHGVR